MIKPNPFLDLVQNREAITSGQFLSLATAAILGYADNVFQFSSDPVLSTLAVYLVFSVVTMLWARYQVWSKNSVVNVAANAAATSTPDINATQPPAP